MTLRECYEKMGGDYADTMERLTKEERIAKYMVKFLEDKTFHILCKMKEEENWKEVFIAVHTLKGVSQNLGFTKLYEASHQMTEAVRGGMELKDNSLYEAVCEAYFETVKVIREYKESVTNLY